MYVCVSGCVHVCVKWYKGRKPMTTIKVTTSIYTSSDFGAIYYHWQDLKTTHIFWWLCKFQRYIPYYIIYILPVYQTPPIQTPPIQTGEHVLTYKCGSEKCNMFGGYSFATFYKNIHTEYMSVVYIKIIIIQMPSRLNFVEPWVLGNCHGGPLLICDYPTNCYL